MLKGLEAVRTLEICCNKIATIEDKIFSEISRLAVVDLSQNQLTRNNRKMFSGIKKSRLIYIYKRTK